MRHLDYFGWIAALSHSLRESTESLDHARIRKARNPWSLAASSVICAISVLCTTRASPSSTFTDAQLNCLLLALSVFAPASSIGMHFKQPPIPWHLNLLDTFLFGTLALTFTVCTNAPACYMGVASYILCVLTWGLHGGFTWPYFIVVVLWPFSLSWLAPPELALPAFIAVALPIYCTLSIGTGRALATQAQTEQVQTIQLQQASHLVGLGRLSVGLTHELNQHICSVQGFVQRLQRAQPDEPSRLSEELQFIAVAAEHMSHIVENVQRIGQARGAAEATVAPSVALERALLLLENQLRAKGILVSILDTISQVPGVYCGPTQLEQVFINLLLNAMDALGTLPPAHRRRIFVMAEQRKDMVVIAVEDNGPGVMPQHRDRLFDAEFTTKQLQGGCGLGLWISRSYALACGGDLRYEARSNGGARFLVELPLAAHEHNWTSFGGKPGAPNLDLTPIG